MKVDAVIEIPMGTRNKYEIDKKNGKIKLDRVLFSSVTYPTEYGYIDKTLADDGDALDILVISTCPTFPGCEVEARVLGYLDITDNGFKDEKVIAVVDKDPRFDNYQTLADIPNHTKEEIREFFKTYKKLQKIKVETFDFHDLDETIKLIEKCKINYNNSNY